MTRYPYRRSKRKLPLPDGLTEVLFEFRQVGRMLRVCAIDAQSGTEVIMVADPRYGETMIKSLAMRKLAYVLRKKRGAKKRQVNQNSGWF